MSRTIISLNGAWRMKGCPAGSLSDDAISALVPDASWIEATVPGDVHAALVKHTVIPDPTWGDNVRQCGWVLEQDWCLSRSFSIERLPAGRRASLLFEGIDTFSSVWLNGTRLGATDNMFREYRFGVTDLVDVGGENRLLIVIRSIRHVLRGHDNDRYVSLFSPNRVFLRKTQCQFGWDCIPDLPSTGVWKDCALVLADEWEIQAVQIVTLLDGSVSFFVSVNLPPRRSELDGIAVRYVPENLGIELELCIRELDGTRVAEEVIPVEGGKSHATLRVADPRLWWPNGLGEPDLYRYRVALRRGGQVLDEREGRFGIREVKLRQDPQGKREFGFRFEVNGVPVFSKGANWIPADTFVGAIRPERYRDLVRRAREAHFNVLRVWGGGIYESDVFYDLCDENGIMVWQEFPCSCSDLPGDQEWFLKAVIPELEHQVKRLRNHPSLVYWTGGNETASVTGCRPSHGDVLLDYLVRGICGHLDPTRPYGPASPSSFSDLGSDQLSGDSHISAFEATCANGPGSFRTELERIRTRFNSELACMGPPRYRSLMRYMPQAALWPMNEMWELRNRRNPYSWTLKDSYSQTQLKLAEGMFGEAEGVKDFLKKAMTAHAELLGGEIEYHRSRKWENSGVMFWMLNDIWPTGTYSVVDYYLLPKPAFYAAKRAYRPLIVTIQRIGGEEVVYVVNDTLRPVAGELEVGQADLRGAVVWSARQRLSVAANASEKVENLAPRRQAAPGTYLFARYRNDFQDADARLFPDPWKDVEWPDPAITSTVCREERSGRIRTKVLSIRCRHYARLVNITHPLDASLRYSDNFFDMEAGSQRLVSIESEEDFSVEGLEIDHWLTEWE